MARKTKHSKLFKSKFFVPITALISLVLIFLVSSVALGFSGMHNVYYKTTKLDGMSKEKITSIIEEDLSTEYDKKEINITYKDYKMPVKVSDVFSVDTDKTIKEADEIVINSSFLGNIKSVFTKTVISPEYIENKTELLKRVEKFIDDNIKNTDFYTISEDYSNVEIDFSSDYTIIDENDIVDRFFEAAKNKEFLDIEMKALNSVDEDQAKAIENIINCEPTDAYISFDENPDGKIIPEKKGITIDEDELISHLKNKDKKFTVKIISVKEPKVTEKELKKVRPFNDVLGMQTSPYNAGLTGRTNNLILAAKKCNGKILQPGDVFSFNNVVGKRSYENGFKDAIVFTGDGMEDGVGGGICQISSTIYSAQLKADLKTVARTNHNYKVSYVPNGQDATVVYGSIDYKFENSSKYPIKIVATVSGGIVTVKILGTIEDTSKKVEILNTTVSTSDFSTINRETDTLKAGQTQVKQKGSTGLTVNTYKIYYSNGKEVSRKFVSKSVYQPMNKIVLVGKDIAKAEKPSETETQNSQNSVPSSTPETEQPITNENQNTVNNENLSDNGL